MRQHQNRWLRSLESQGFLDLSVLVLVLGTSTIFLEAASPTLVWKAKNIRGVYIPLLAMSARTHKDEVLGTVEAFPIQRTSLP